MVTYGKTLGGGLPGRRGLRAQRADASAFARTGRPTSASRAGRSTPIPTSWARCSEFLERLDTAQVQALYARSRANLERRVSARSTSGCADDSLPVRDRQPVEHLDGLLHAAIAAINWMLQYYLRSQGLALSWVGTGRLDLQPQLFRQRTLRPLPTGSLPPPKPCEPTAGGGKATQRWRRTPPSGGKSCGKCCSIDLQAWSARAGYKADKRCPLVPQRALFRGNGRIDQLAAQQRQRRLVIKFNVVERVGQDLGDPYQARLHVLDDEQLLRIRKSTPITPSPNQILPRLPREAGPVAVGRDEAEQGGLGSRSRAGNNAQIAISTTLRRRL